MELNPNIATMKPYSPGRTIPGAIKLSSNENPLGPSPLALSAIRNNLNTIHRYPDGSSHALRQALSETWETTPESILITNGSDELFSFLTASWMRPGDNIITARETFSQYRFATTLFKGSTIEIPLLKARYDLEKIHDSINRNTRLIFICNPNNPTGTYITHHQLKEFLTSVPTGIIIVIDEAYADFARAEDFPDSRTLLKTHPNLVISRTFSKLYGLGGLRIGYGTGNENLIRESSRAAMPFNVNTLAQIAARAALQDTDHQTKTLNMVHKGLDTMSTELTHRQLFFHPSQANFICIDINQPIAPLWEKIAHAGIAIRDLASFGFPTKLRYTISTEDHNQKFLSILDNIL